jgi:hypothetical protein
MIGHPYPPTRSNDVLMAKRTEERKGTKKSESPFATVEEAIEDIRRGRMVVVCDDENRENEGDRTTWFSPAMSSR